MHDLYTGSDAHRLLVRRISTSLNAWEGFETIAAAMRRLTEVDVYLVGGSLRNAVAEIDAPTTDFDFMVQGPQTSEFLEILRSVGALTRGPFGSPRWRRHSDDRVYADVIPVTTFNNGLWHCQDIIDALNQFDFTANAIALDIATHELYDPQNGVRDARARIIRAVRFDYPSEPISDFTEITRNSVLWFRLIHYANKLNFSIDSVTRRWVKANEAYLSDEATFSSLFFPPLINY
jgi:tRNA nucleotidyltransferase/poly(A) polymerase